MTIFEIEEELENLREELNRTVNINMINTSNEYKDLLSISKELDEIIVNHMKISNNEV